MESHDDRTLGEKVSDSVARFGGSWHFIILGFAILICWVLINALPFWAHWDEYPFVLLNLFLSLIAAFQAPFILMAQGRVERKQDAIYRALFSEIKDLVEVDLSIEHEVLESNRKLEKELEEIKSIIKVIKGKNEAESDV